MGDEQLTPGLEFTVASAADLSVLDQLRDHGADLSKARHVKAYIYFRTRPDAERAAADLASEGFRGSLGSNDAEDSWLATVDSEIVVSAESIADLSTRLQAVADRPRISDCSSRVWFAQATSLSIGRSAQVVRAALERALSPH